MNHYSIDVGVTKEQVTVIKEQFQAYLEEAGGFTIHITSDSGQEPSPELQAVLKKMLLDLLVTIHYGKFTEVH